MKSMIDVLNTIRANATQLYQDRIPVATPDNIEDIRLMMTDDNNVQVANEFTSTLLNKLIRSIIHTKMFQNPLKALKKGTKPMGDTVEEIYVNFLKGTEYDPTGAKLMERKLPDVKVVYHRMNYQMQYPITIGPAELSKAFKSYDHLNTFIQNTIQSLYNSAEWDEFIHTKQLITAALAKKALKQIPVVDPMESKENGQEFIKTVKTISGLMKFPSEEWNSYLTAQSKDKKPIVTFSRPEEQVLILPTAVDTSVNVDVLANIFNMSVAEFNETKKIVIDVFPDTADGLPVYGALVDEAFFQIFDDLIQISTFYNGMGLYHNYFLNVWQTYAYSILVNGVVFVGESAADV